MAQSNDKRYQSAIVGGGGAGMGTYGIKSIEADVRRQQEESTGRIVEVGVQSVGGIASGKHRIARVVSNATGGGHYNCQLQKLSASNWGSNTDPFESDGSTAIVVLNIPEAGKTDSHQLSAGKKMAVWRQRDDGSPGKMRWIGVEMNYLYRCPPP